MCGLSLWETTRANTSWCKKPIASSEAKHKLPSLNQYLPLHRCRPHLPLRFHSFIHHPNSHYQTAQVQAQHNHLHVKHFSVFSCSSELQRKGASCIYILTLIKVLLYEPSWRIYKDYKWRRAGGLLDTRALLPSFFFLPLY